MKLDVNAQEFSDAYQAAFSAVGSRVSLFKLCLLECSDKCQVTGRSPVHAATVTVPDVTIQEHGEIMLPEVFGDLLSAVGDADMRIEQEGDCLSVTGDKFSYALQTMGVPDGFRRWAESGSVKAGEFTIPGHIVSGIYRHLFRVCGKDGKFVMSGVRIDVRDGDATFIASDGKRIARAPVSVESNNFSVTVPVSSWKMFHTLFALSPVVKLTVYDREIVLEADGKIARSMLLDGAFPDWRRFIGYCNPDKRTTVDPERFVSAALQAGRLTAVNSLGVVCGFRPGYLTISNKCEENRGRVDVPIDYTGEAVEVCLNYRYLRDFLKSVDKGVPVEVGFSDAEGMVSLKSGQFETIIAPIRDD